MNGKALETHHTVIRCLIDWQCLPPSHHGSVAEELHCSLVVTGSKRDSTGKKGAHCDAVFWLKT